jgi:DNA-binding protein H-NS
MTTYKDLQNQIVELQRKAEEARAQELDGAIKQVKALMQEYGIAIEDLASPTKKKGAKQGQANAQFRDAAGNTWSGRGRMPAWLKGKDKERFRVS